MAHKVWRRLDISSPPPKSDRIGPDTKVTVCRLQPKKSVHQWLMPLLRNLNHLDSHHVAWFPLPIRGILLTSRHSNNRTDLHRHVQDQLRSCTNALPVSSKCSLIRSLTDSDPLHSDKSEPTDWSLSGS